MLKNWRPNPERRLICHKQTGRFLTAAGRWTRDPAKAKDFPSIFQALIFCCEQDLPTSELTYKFESSQESMALPLMDAIGREENQATPPKADFDRVLLGMTETNNPERAPSRATFRKTFGMVSEAAA